MTTWFAQTTGNINAANQWNSIPAGGGTVLTWPPAANDILVANGKTIRVNVSTTVAELQNDARSSATLGGNFELNTNGVSLVANGYNSASQNTGIVRLTLASGTVYFVGNLYGGGLTNSAGMLISTGIGSTLNLTGNVYAGSGTSAIGLNLTNTHTGVVNVTGSVYGNDAGSSPGLSHNTAGTVTLTGNSIAGNFANAFGVTLGTSGTSLTITGYAQASNTASGVSNLGQGVLTVGETRSASNGRGAVIGAFRFASATSAKSLPLIAGNQKTLSVLNVAALVPAVEDVRDGVIYGDGAYIGTLALKRKRISMEGRF